jgi:hypothetical protein
MWGPRRLTTLWASQGPVTGISLPFTFNIHQEDDPSYPGTQNMHKGSQTVVLYSEKEHVGLYKHWADKSLEGTQGQRKNGTRFMV